MTLGNGVLSGSLYHETAAEALKAWDSGDSVFTLEMGGLGPGYEQCIHVACFEVIRDMANDPVPADEEGLKAWSAKADVALHRADKFPDMGMSGAQAGAAKSLAYNFIKEGPRAFLERVKREDAERGNDIIQVCRRWPRPANE